MFRQFSGKVIGLVRLRFAQGEPATGLLVVGHNIREWKILDAQTVSSTSSLAVEQVWDSASQDGDVAIVDLLRIDIPSTIGRKSSDSYVSLPSPN